MSKILQIPKIVNGDKVVHLQNGENMKRSMQNFDWNTVKTLGEWYVDEAKDMGMVNLFSNFVTTSKPVYQGFFNNTNKNTGILETNGITGRIKYRLPIVTNNYLRIVKDSTPELGNQGAVGAHDTTFHIYLNQRMSAGDILSPALRSARKGDQLQVTEHLPENVKEEGGSMYKTYVRMTTRDAFIAFDTSLLRTDTRWIKIGHATAPEGTKLSKPQFETSVSEMACEFSLGNLGGVEMGGNIAAQEKLVTNPRIGLNSYLLNDFMRDIESKNMDGLDMNTVVISDAVRVGKTMKTGKPKIVGAYQQFYVTAEYIRLENLKLMFAQEGHMNDLHGGQHINEGLWYQWDRGFTIPYGRPDGIAINHFQIAANYVFRNSTIPMKDRMMTWDCGHMAYNNGLRLTRDYNFARLGRVQGLGLQGDSPYFPENPVGGSLDSMYIKEIGWDYVLMDGVGKVKFRHDTSLDFEPNADTYNRGYTGTRGHSDSSYSMIMWDVTDPVHSNAISGLPEKTKLVNGNLSTTNIFYVRPQNRSFWFGKDQGRYSSDNIHGGASQNYILSSRPNFDESFWCYGSSAVWQRDKTRTVKIAINRRVQ